MGGLEPAGISVGNFDGAVGGSVTRYRGVGNYGKSTQRNVTRPNPS